MTLSTCFVHPGDCRSHSPAFVLVRSLFDSSGDRPRAALASARHGNTRYSCEHNLAPALGVDIRRRPQARHEEDYIIHCGRDLVMVPIKDFVRRTAQLERAPLDKLTGEMLKDCLATVLL